jgi:hypothetical protein
MTVVRQKNITAKIFDNVLFLAEVFGDRADQDIPKVPVLEMARCFDLAPAHAPTEGRGSRTWPLWK